MATRKQQADDGVGYQEGSRWVNKRPSGDEVAAWFKANAPMHEGMDPERYVTGVVLIPAKERVRKAVQNQQGNVVLLEEEQLVHVPYIKVETRVAYFWDLMLKNDWHGVIEPADVPRVDGEGLYNKFLPKGFFRMPVQNNAGAYVHHLCCSMQVRVYDRSERGGKGAVRMEPPAGTKMVPVLDRYGADEFSLMKAETGAIGRALALAGMLVLPGSGVASADDMQELGNTPRGGAAVAAQLPSDVPPAAGPAAPGAGADAAAAEASSTDVRSRIAELSARLQSERPLGFEEVVAWAGEKKIDLEDLKDHQLRGVMRKMEQRLEGPE
jgi:hypothetical protein